jgi:2-amino-4-hydroxy-6-hydroxymethyldihydropteridine diphosphokinase
MNTAYLLIGGNMGDREKNLQEAKELISHSCGEILKTSSTYETEAWGNTNQPAFLNQAIELSTLLNARQLIRRLLKTEKMMGRVRKEKFGPRTIDIDILFFNDEIINLRFLKIPHPEIQNRRFALVPLTEINPSLLHPVLKKTTRLLLKECKDELAVRKLNN